MVNRVIKTRLVSGKTIIKGGYLAFATLPPTLFVPFTRANRILQDRVIFKEIKPGITIPSLNCFK